MSQKKKVYEYEENHIYFLTLACKYKWNIMKKYLILIILLFAVLSVYSQRRGQVIKWFSLAAKGGVGNSLLLNPDIFSEAGADSDVFTLSYSYGGRFTFSYGDNLGVGVDVLSSSFGQNYTLVTGIESYEKQLKLTSLDISPFFRYSGYGGGYFEIGPTFTTLKSAEETNSIQGTFFPRDNLMEIYENKLTDLMVGFGMAAVRTERLAVNLGLRASYGFTDMVPNHQNDYVLNDGVYFPEIISDKETHALSLKFFAELNYFFAFWGDASCGRGRLVFFQ